MEKEFIGVSGYKAIVDEEKTLFLLNQQYVKKIVIYHILNMLI